MSMMDEIVRLTREIDARQKAWLRRPAEVGIDDVGPILRGVCEMTCPRPHRFRAGRTTVDRLEAAAATRNALHWMMSNQALLTVPVQIDEDVPDGRVAVEWPSWTADSEGATHG